MQTIHAEEIKYDHGDHFIFLQVIYIQPKFTKQYLNIVRTALVCPCIKKSYMINVHKLNQILSYEFDI